MYVGEEIVREAERRWGAPGEVGFRVPATDAEIDFIRSTMKHGRAHDVTLLIRDGDLLAVIAKPPYPPGVFRPPSGGLEPGESMEEGILREGREETGLDLVVVRYLLRARVRFEARAPVESIDWVSHVFDTRPVGGRLEPMDRHEVREAAWVTREQLLGPIRERLRSWSPAGIQYRWRLHDAIFAELDRQEGGGPPRQGEGA